MNQAALTRARRYQRVAAQVWNPTDPIACEASVLLEHAAKMETLQSLTIAARLTQLAGRVFA